MCFYSILVLTCKKQNNNHKLGIQTNWSREEKIRLGERRSEKEHGRALYDIFLNEIIVNH